MNETHPDAERYREAAKLAIEQLRWVISYFHRIRRPGIATALEKNLRTILEHSGL